MPGRPSFATALKLLPNFPVCERLYLMHGDAARFRVLDQGRSLGQHGHAPAPRSTRDQGRGLGLPYSQNSYRFDPAQLAQVARMPMPQPFLCGQPSGHPGKRSRPKILLCAVGLGHLGHCGRVKSRQRFNRPTQQLGRTRPASPVCRGACRSVLAARGVGETECRADSPISTGCSPNPFAARRQ